VLTIACFASLQGVFVDSEGTVLSGPDCSIGILTRDGVLVIPPDDTGLAGMAARNMAELAMQVRCCCVSAAAVRSCCQATQWCVLLLLLLLWLQEAVLGCWMASVL
jgi:hypothetical protein